MKRLLLLLLMFASTAYGEIYTWKDARGTVFYTNSLHEIPSRYRSRAKQLDVAIGKKMPISATAPAGSGPAPTSQQPALVQQAPPQQMQSQPTQAPSPAPATASTANPAPGSSTVGNPVSPTFRSKAPRNRGNRINRTEEE